MYTHMSDIHIELSPIPTSASAHQNRKSAKRKKKRNEKREKEKEKERSATFTRGNFYGTRKKKRICVNSANRAVRASVSNRLPRIRFYSASTTLLRSRDGSQERRDRRRLRHVENSATSAEWLDGDTAGRFFSGVTRAHGINSVGIAPGNSHDHSKFLTCRTRVSNTPPRWHLALHFSLRQALGNEPKIGWTWLLYIATEESMTMMALERIKTRKFLEPN